MPHPEVVSSPLSDVDEPQNELLQGLSSTAAVLVELDSGRQLASVAADQPLAPASLTKLMTIFTALQLLDTQQEVTLDSSFFPSLWEQNASMAGLLPGETVPVTDLLYGVLLPSGAECCEGLAQAAGGQQVLVDEMNRQAELLGMNGSHFENPTGLDQPGHLATAADLATLLQEALREEHQPFRTIFTSWNYTTTKASAHPQGITFESTLSAHRDQLRGEGWEVLGGKTGFTDEAGLCLATLAKVNEKEYLLVTLGAPGISAQDTAHIADASLVWSRLAALE